MLRSFILLPALIACFLFSFPSRPAARGTAGGPDTTTVYHIPVVFHIVHDYGAEYLPDTSVYNILAQMNKLFNREEDYGGIIPPFAGNITGTGIRYVGNAKIRFHLATISPDGAGTSGITRRRSYLTAKASDTAKFDAWPHEQYLNIWIVRSFTFPYYISGYGYSYPPIYGANVPVLDGIVLSCDYPTSKGDLARLAAHFLNLADNHGDGYSRRCVNDLVDDTPPSNKASIYSGVCDARFADSVSHLWDTSCVAGYSVFYTKPYAQAMFGIEDTITIDYPDTINAQNIMMNSVCGTMFTYGQTLRMRAALNSPIGSRNNLWTPANLAATGALVPTPDFAPLADYSSNKVFACAGVGGNVAFTNRSWRDTVSNYNWIFANGTPATGTVANPGPITFTQTGWATVRLDVTSNAGSGTITRKRGLYIADPTAIAPDSYFQEFDGSDTSMYPIFNHYDSVNYKWELYDGAGFYDNKCMRFKNYDPRTALAPENITQTPGGLYADFYTRAFDLSGPAYANKGILTFYTASASKYTGTRGLNDTLEVYYSNNCGNSWSRIFPVPRSALAGKYEPAEFIPAGMADWKLQGITLPMASRSNRTFFRFRYKPGVDTTAQTKGLGTGNHFYLDRIHITTNALGIDVTEPLVNTLLLAPNPTSGAAIVTIIRNDNSNAQVTVTDITGRTVYKTEAILSKTETLVEIPAGSLAGKGMYLVQVIANGTAVTKKLVVY